MSDGALETFTKLVNSPPGQLAAGGVLAGVVWKFFDRVEAVLSEQKKNEVADWLLRKPEDEMFTPWPQTFLTLIGRVFGTETFPYLRSTAISSILFCLVAVIPTFPRTTPDPWLLIVGVALLSAIYLSIPLATSAMKTRWLIGRMLDRGTSAGIIFSTDIVLSLALSVYSVATFAALGLLPYESLRNSVVEYSSMAEADFNRRIDNLEGEAGDHLFRRSKPDVLSAIRAQRSGHALLAQLYLLKAFVRRENPWIYVATVIPAMFPSVLLLLYAGSGFLLKSARRFDLGFDWFRRMFDIERKPLQSIGLVAGALVAVVYWTAVIVSRVVE